MTQGPKIYSFRHFVIVTDGSFAAVGLVTFMALLTDDGVALLDCDVLVQTATHPATVHPSPRPAPSRPTRYMDMNATVSHKDVDVVVVDAPVEAVSSLDAPITNVDANAGAAAAHEERPKWGSTAEFILAAVGSAVRTPPHTPCVFDLRHPELQLDV